MKRVIDIFADYSHAIIEQIETMDPPWIEDNPIICMHDYDYILNHASLRVISPLTYNMLGNDETLSIYAIHRIATIIYDTYNYKWSKLYATLKLTYNPITNYDMTESMTNDITTHEYGKIITRTDNMSELNTGTETTEHDITVTRTDNLQTQSVNENQGFNSLSYNSNTRDTINNTGTEQTETHGTDTLTHNTTRANTGTQTHADSGVDTDKHQYQLTRSGNIGVTTTQDMIQSERSVAVYSFINVVYADIDSILTIPYYDMD